MKLIFKGIVQGVGFRPTIYRIAKDLDLKGYVLNRGSEVEVVLDKNVDIFIQLVKKNLPSIAKISDINYKPDNRKFDDFRILHRPSQPLKAVTSLLYVHFYVLSQVYARHRLHIPKPESCHP